MAIDFYSESDIKRKTLLFGIEQKDFDLIDNAIAELERKTGLAIDRYGTSRIGVAHLKIVTSAIQKILNDCGPGDFDKRKRLEHLLAKLSGTSEGFLIIGD